MARKKPPEEHENLERWLVSYGDFITLLFATFVVLYALAQSDAVDYQKLEEALKNVFESNNIMDAQDMILEGNPAMFDNYQANSFIPGLMMEMMSKKYEDEAFKEIEESIERLKKSGELEGITATMKEEGLLITFDDKYLFAPASATLNSKAKNLLDKVGVLICKKFVLHSMKVEGHTDSEPISSPIYPSNWELSSARSSSVVRYMIQRFHFGPNLFSAIGFADTRPAEGAYSRKDPKNRRVEIFILKNSYRDEYDRKANNVMSLSTEEQQRIQKDRAEVISKVEHEALTPEARKLLEENRMRLAKKQKSEKLSKNNMQIYIKLDNETNTTEKNDLPKVDKPVIKLQSNVPEDEDFGL